MDMHFFTNKKASAFGCSAVMQQKKMGRKNEREKKLGRKIQSVSNPKNAGMIL